MKRTLMILFLLAALIVGCSYRWQPQPTEENNMPGLSPLAAEFSGADGEVVDFGYLPRVWNDNGPDTISMSAWIYPTAYQSGDNNIGYVMSFSGVSTGGLFFAVFEPNEAPGTQRILVVNTIFQNSGGWRALDLSIPVNNWHHVVFTYDMSSDANDPVMYLNGVSQTVTEVDTPIDTGRFSKRAPLLIGNINSASYAYLNTFTGRIFDARIYNVILSQANVTALYNDGAPSMLASTGREDYIVNGKHRTDLVFQAFAVLTENLASYTDADLTGLKLFDAQYLMVGEVFGSVTGRAAPVAGDRGAMLKEDEYYLLKEDGGHITLDGIEWH